MLMTMTMMMVMLAKRTTKRTTMIAWLMIMTVLMVMSIFSDTARESWVCSIVEPSLRVYCYTAGSVAWLG